MQKLNSDVFNDAKLKFVKSSSENRYCWSQIKIAIVNERGRVAYGSYESAVESGEGSWFGVGDGDWFFPSAEIYCDTSSYPDGCIIKRFPMQ